MGDYSELVYALAGMPRRTPEDLKSVYGYLAPAPNTEYGSILPIARDTNTGQVRMAMPSMVREGLLGMVDLAGGTATGELTPRAIESVTMGGVGAGATMAPRGALAAGAAKPIRAYHGSPHDFDRFDISKIGTGEGAQAYGHGLYFAESPRTAQYYRENLAGQPEMEMVKLGNMRLTPRNDWDYSRNASRSTLDNIHASLAEDVLIDQAGFVGAPDKRAFVLNLLDNKIKDYQQSWPEGVAEAQKLRAMLERPGAIDLRMGAQPGKMYEVNIHADPNRFLDWDKPFLEQSPQVRSLLSSPRMSDPYIAGKSSTGEAYSELAGLLGSRAEASKVLLDAGIPGTRYLDGVSRDLGQGTSNYAVFDDKTIEILRKYGLLPPAPLAAPPQPTPDLARALAEQYLKERVY